MYVSTCTTKLLNHSLLYVIKDCLVHSIPSGLQVALYHEISISTSVSNVLFDVMIDRLHDVALTVGSCLYFTRAAVKLVV